MPPIRSGAANAPQPYTTQSGQSVTRDNSFYSAVSHQLFGTPTRHTGVRTALVNHMRANAPRFSSLVQRATISKGRQRRRVVVPNNHPRAAPTAGQTRDLGTVNVNVDVLETFEQYLARMASPDERATIAEAHAVAGRFAVNVQIVVHGCLLDLITPVPALPKVRTLWIEFDGMQYASLESEQVRQILAGGRESKPVVGRQTGVTAPLEPVGIEEEGFRPVVPVEAEVKDVKPDITVLGSRQRQRQEPLPSLLEVLTPIRKPRATKKRRSTATITDVPVPDLNSWTTPAPALAPLPSPVGTQDARIIHPAPIGAAAAGMSPHGVRFPFDMQGNEAWWQAYPFDRLSAEPPTSSATTESLSARVAGGGTSHRQRERQRERERAPVLPSMGSAEATASASTSAPGRVTTPPWARQGYRTAYGPTGPLGHLYAPAGPLGNRYAPPSSSAAFGTTTTTCGGAPDTATPVASSKNSLSVSNAASKGPSHQSQQRRTPDVAVYNHTVPAVVPITAAMPGIPECSHRTQQRSQAAYRYWIPTSTASAASGRATSGVGVSATPRLLPQALMRLQQPTNPTNPPPQSPTTASTSDTAIASTGSTPGSGFSPATPLTPLPPLTPSYAYTPQDPMVFERDLGLQINWPLSQLRADGGFADGEGAGEAGTGSAGGGALGLRGAPGTVVELGWEWSSGAAG